MIVWDDIVNLPFPEEVKETIKDVDWNGYEWHASGLPVHAAKYSMVGGKNLYLSELPNGETKVEKAEHFTGNILMAGFFVTKNEADGSNYFVNFVVTILKGEVVEVKLNQMKRQPFKEYELAMKDFNNNIRKSMIVTNSWWFKWLYRPWFLTVRSGAYVLLFIFSLLKEALIWTVNKLTPL